MNNYCAFSQNHKCVKWTDYEIIRAELEEADSLCHDNWLEMEQLRLYIKTLQEILDNYGIPYSDKI